jgi:hypothetical protein
MWLRLICELTVRASPDERNHPQDYTAKRDIWNSGILFVEFLLGSKANMIYGDLNSLRHSKSSHIISADIRSASTRPHLRSVGLDDASASKETSDRRRDSRETSRTRKKPQVHELETAL